MAEPAPDVPGRARGGGRSQPFRDQQARKRQPARLVVAVPVASADTVDWLRAEADEVVCLSMPANFMAVGQFYIQFPQLDDEDVIRLLKDARHFGAADHL